MDYHSMMTIFILSFIIFSVSKASNVSEPVNFFGSNKTSDIELEPEPRPIPTVRGSFNYKLKPMAVGGIGLITGLIIITLTVGVFIMIAKRRQDQFVYEPAATEPTSV